MADLQQQQQDRSSPWAGACSLASEALRHQGITLHAGVGAAVPSTVPEEWRQVDQRRGTLEKLVLPSSLRPDVQGRSGNNSQLYQQLRDVHGGAMLWGKGRGYDAWYGRSVMPCACMLWVAIALRVLNLCNLSGVGLD